MTEDEKRNAAYDAQAKKDAIEARARHEEKMKKKNARKPTRDSDGLARDMDDVFKGE